jgi:hypothetical protein
MFIKICGPDCTCYFNSLPVCLTYKQNYFSSDVDLRPWFDDNSSKFLSSWLRIYIYRNKETESLESNWCPWRHEDSRKYNGWWSKSLVQMFKLKSCFYLAQELLVESSLNMKMILFIVHGLKQGMSIGNVWSVWGWGCPVWLSDQPQVVKCPVRLSDMIYIYIYLTAIGLTPGGSTTTHIYTQTVHIIQRTYTQYRKHNNIKN